MILERVAQKYAGCEIIDIAVLVKNVYDVKIKSLQGVAENSGRPLEAFNIIKATLDLTGVA